ncbi:tail fiber domain-containing protein [Spirosoma sp. BT702]|uniref:Tail fiber domain-containing protein n=1 Tax=Spirosoma profusum TaxID=2771354 RepID=A0A926Y449_9BACT|nr:tail fiber domain-containing protein [Spirosoma profusum]MBD2702740.1 tail fiber domain-containing protein [Spirosoma profusum]
MKTISTNTVAYVLMVLLLGLESAYGQIRLGPPASGGALDGSSSLEVKSGPYPSGSPYRGLLSPVVSTTQRDQIQSPAKGLLIFNTSTNQIEVNTGSPTAPVWSAGGSANSGANAWNLNGNPNLTSSSYLGTPTTPGQVIPINFKINNGRAGYIDAVKFNLAFGALTLNEASTGQGNTALGGFTLQAMNTNASFNTAVGYRAMFANLTGFANVASGSFTLEHNTTGHDNTAMGNGALRENTGGNYNTAIGTGALVDNTTGFENVSIGGASLRYNNTGYSNVAVGQDALTYNTNGANNVAVGSSALYNSASNDNVAVGTLVMFNNTTGRSNTALGVLAGQNNTVGGYNVFLGINAGVNNAGLSSNNTYVGVNAGVSSSAVTTNNSSSLGYEARVNADNQIQLGNINITSLRCKVQLTVTSDKRIKENVQSNVPGLNFITKLNPVTYNINKLKEAQLIGYTSDDIQEDRSLHTGFLAQDVETAAKSVGYDFEGIHTEKGGTAAEGGKYYTLGYSLFVVPLVQAVKDLNSEVETLKAKLQKQESDYNQLAAQVKQMQALLGVKTESTSKAGN